MPSKEFIGGRAAELIEALQAKYQHGSPLHKAVFMALDDYTGGDDFEIGVRRLIAELADLKGQRSMFQKQRVKTCAALKERNDAREKLADIRRVLEMKSA